MERDDSRVGLKLQNLMAIFTKDGLLLNPSKAEPGALSGKWQVSRGSKPGHDVVELLDHEGQLEGLFHDLTQRNGERFPVIGKRNGDWVYFTYTVKTLLPNQQVEEAAHIYIGKLDTASKMTGDLDRLITQVNLPPQSEHLFWCAERISPAPE